LGRFENQGHVVLLTHLFFRPSTGRYVNVDTAAPVGGVFVVLLIILRVFGLAVIQIYHVNVPVPTGVKTKRNQ
jgi:hypothetical protein